MPTHRHLPPNAPTSLDLPEVYSVREVADAAGVAPSMVAELITGAEIQTVDGELITLKEAARAIADIRTGRLKPPPWGGRPGVFGRALLAHTTADRQSQGLSALMSTGLHAAVVAVVVVLTTVGLTTATDDDGEREPPQLARLIFVADPGPGGGGGGGGLKMPTPAPKAQREGVRAVASPVPERVEPRRVEPMPEPEPPAPLENESLPTIFAPLIASPSDSRDVRGLVIDLPADDDESQGPGIDNGVGSGAGTGIGSGRGSGLGDGSGGGTGGGPYRAGSGIDPPRLLHEARPRYTEEARQQGVEGDVILEIVVRSDGSVGDIRVVHRLGFGLDEQAVQAVRQWRFAAATRFGTPVDVLVEVAVEFQLR